MNTLVLPGNLKDLEKIRGHIKAAAQEAGIDRKLVYRLILAVDEIATNAIVYGFERVGMEGELRVRVEVLPACFRVILEDNGPPYDPHRAPEPNDLASPPEERKVGGLGVFLSMQNVDSLLYEHEGDWNRNIFTVNLSP